MRAFTASALVLAAVCAVSTVHAQDLALTEVWLGDQPFVEIANVGDTDVSLQGVWLAGSPEAAAIAAGEGAALALGEGTLEPGAVAVVAASTRARFGDDVLVLGNLSDAGVALAPASGMAWLFAWDGASDLVADIDVVRWGDDAPALERGGVEVDGPDEDDVATAYAADTAVDAQQTLPPLVRRGIVRRELSDVSVGEGGNGVDGGDETAEALNTTWGITGVPTPGAGNVEDEFVVRGHVTRNGAAVLGLPVSIALGEETRAQTTGSDGFRFDGFGRDAGAFLLTLGEGEDAAQFEGTLDDANEVVDVDLSDAVEVQLRVALVARTVPDVSVTATLGLPQEARVIAPAGEPIVFADVPPGTWTLEVGAPGFESATERLTVGGATDAEFVLYPAAPVRLHLHVLTARGVPANGAEVTLAGVGHRAGVARTGVVSEGRMSFDDVPPGYYRVVAELAAESVLLDGVDVLAASEVTLRMASKALDPPVSTVSNCATAPPAGGAGMALLALAALAWRRRC